MMQVSLVNEIDDLKGPICLNKGLKWNEMNIIKIPGRGILLNQNKMRLKTILFLVGTSLADSLS